MSVKIKKINRRNNAKYKQIVILCRYKIEKIITDEKLHFIHKINLLYFNIKKFTVKVYYFNLFIYRRYRTYMSNIIRIN